MNIYENFTYFKNKFLEYIYSTHEFMIEFADFCLENHIIL